MLLSLVIPFYHVEKYIGDCLAALHSLPESECEILLVDDCGTDGSLEIAASFCNTRGNARVIRRSENGGLSAARNSGLIEAKGEYVFFLDSDDIPDGDSILKLAKRAKASGLEIIKGRFDYLEDGSGAVTPGPRTCIVENVKGVELFNLENAENVYEPMVWQCLYKREFLLKHHLEMTPGLLFEDELFTTPALILAEHVSGTDVCLLKYRQRTGSIMGGFKTFGRWNRSYLEICRRLTDFGQAHQEAEPALSIRIGKIAISLAKNIEAYRMEGENRRMSIRFLYENRQEIAGYAKRGNLALKAQAAVFLASPRLYLAVYGGLLKIAK